MGDAGASGDLPHAQSGGAQGLDLGDRGLEHRFPQAAVVVGLDRRSRHGREINAI